MNEQQSVLKEKSLSVGRQRTAVLIRCTETEAGLIRSQARHERRSISGYVLAVLDRSIAIKGLLSAGMTGFKAFKRL